MDFVVDNDTEKIEMECLFTFKEVKSDMMTHCQTFSLCRRKKPVLFDSQDRILIPITKFHWLNRPIKLRGYLVYSPIGEFIEIQGLKPPYMTPYIPRACKHGCQIRTRL